MLMIDLQSTTARLTVKEILSAGTLYVSNPNAFAAFVAGFRPTSDLLLDSRWKMPAGASRHFAFFQMLLHRVLPSIYNVRHLEKIGGRITFRLTGVGDYTITAFNRRVITFKGLAVDDTTGRPVIDIEMRPQVLMALCNELIANISEATLQALSADASNSAAREKA
jgi:hypothetical protein